MSRNFRFRPRSTICFVTHIASFPSMFNAPRDSVCPFSTSGHTPSHHLFLGGYQFCPPKQIERHPSEIGYFYGFSGLFGLLGPVRPDRVLVSLKTAIFLERTFDFYLVCKILSSSGEDGAAKGLIIVTPLQMKPLCRSSLKSMRQWFSAATAIINESQICSL